MEMQPVARNEAMEPQVLGPVVSPTNSAIEPRTPRSQTETRLLACWQELFEHAAIGMDDDFFLLGGYSLLAARLMVRIQGEWGITLPLTQLWETPTISELAILIDARCALDKAVPLASSVLVPLQPRGARPPLFCVHAVGGGVWMYQALAQHVGTDQPVYGLQAQGLLDEQPPLTSIEAMATLYIDELRAVQPHGPYQLAGHSFGGLVAYEMAQQLHRGSENVALLALFDALLPYDPSKPRWWSVVRYYLQSWENIASYQLRNLWTLPLAAKAPYVRKRAATVGGWLLSKVWPPYAATYRARRPQPAPVPPQVQAAEQGCHQAARAYRPIPYRGPITYFRAQVLGPKRPFDQNKAWTMLAHGGLQVYAVPGDHVTLINKPHVQTLVRRLIECLDQLQLPPPAQHERATVVSEARERMLEVDG